jgi:hypothetical protein
MTLGRHRLDNKNQVFANVGDFWHFNVKRGPDRDFTRGLSHTQDYNRVLSDIREMPKFLSGKEVWSAEYEELRYEDDKVLALGGDLQKRVLTILAAAADVSKGIPAYVISNPSQYDLSLTTHTALTLEQDPKPAIGTEDCWAILFPKDEDKADFTLDFHIIQNYWLVPTDNIIPQVITSKNGDLVAGVDFNVGRGFIQLRVHPDELFEKNIIPVKFGLKKVPSSFNYARSIDSSNVGGHHVINYYRSKQTSSYFERAIAEAIGLSIMPFTSVLREVIPYCDGYYYIFDDGGFLADYDHPPLIKGELYEEGLVIGELVKIHAKTNMDKNWYRAVDWSEGLMFKGLTRFFPDLIIPDEVRRIQAAELSGIPGAPLFNDYPQLHFDIDGPAFQVERFWTKLWETERLFHAKYGVWLKDVVSEVTQTAPISSVGDTRDVNLLDLYFQAYLQERAMIIELRTQHLGGRHKVALNFINREKPTGSVVMIRDKTAEL